MLALDFEASPDKVNDVELLFKCTILTLLNSIIYISQCFASKVYE